MEVEDDFEDAEPDTPHPVFLQEPVVAELPEVSRSNPQKVAYLDTSGLTTLLPVRRKAKTETHSRLSRIIMPGTTSDFQFPRRH